MARWRLTEPHYLLGRLTGEDATCEWEYKEADRITGREKRKRFKVPDYRPADSIVCHEGSEKDGDFIFEGKPTQGMEPIDEEAREISAKHAKEWVHPIETLPTQLAPETMQMMAEFAKMVQAPTTVAESGVSKAEFDELKAQIAALMEQNAALKASAEPKAPPKRLGLR